MIILLNDVVVDRYKTAEMGRVGDSTRIVADKKYRNRYKRTTRTLEGIVSFV